MTGTNALRRIIDNLSDFDKAIILEIMRIFEALMKIEDFDLLDQVLEEMQDFLKKLKDEKGSDRVDRCLAYHAFVGSTPSEKVLSDKNYIIDFPDRTILKFARFLFNKYVNTLI